MEQRVGLTSAKREVERIGRRIKKLLDLMLDDEIAVDEGKVEIKTLDSRRKELEAQLTASDDRTVHLNGCVEVDGAYRRPAWMARAARPGAVE